jgi:glycosyltransferase involved in cell wall biosynthesis
VSVLVPARNAGADLQGLIAALSRQTLPLDAFELVIGDDGSTDGSTTEVSANGVSMRIVRGPAVNAYAALNRAGEAAEAAVLAICDADCRPEPDWLRAGVEAIDRGDDVVGGAIRWIVPREQTIWTLLDIDLHLDHARDIENNKGLTGNLFVRKDLFDQIGRFDDSLPSGGDHDFVSRCAKAGARLRYLPTAVVWHPTRDSGSRFLRRLWSAHYAHAVRSTLAGAAPRFVGSSFFVPFIGMARSRRGVGLPITLDRQRLAANDVHPGLRQKLIALLVLYLFLPYFAGWARLCGKRHARRLTSWPRSAD